MGRGAAYCRLGPAVGPMVKVDREIDASRYPPDGRWSVSGERGRLPDERLRPPDTRLRAHTRCLDKPGDVRVGGPWRGDRRATGRLSAAAPVGGLPDRRRLQ